MPKSPPEEDPLSFEEAINQLDEIVQAMESDQLPLSELIDQYANGMKLEKFCRDQLSTARNKVETISENVDGSGVEIEPLDTELADGNEPAGSQKSSKKQPKPAPAEDDEIRLF